MKQMDKKLTILLLVVCLSLVGIFFVNAVNNDFEKETGGKHQIKNYSIVSNNANEAKIELSIAKSSKDKVNPSIRVLDENDLVYAGEGQIKDPNLGKYRVELQFTDVRLQKNLAKQLGLKKHILGKQAEDLLESIKVAYPPDDALMVVYLGCSSKPQTQIVELEDKIVITLKK